MSLSQKEETNGGAVESAHNNGSASTHVYAAVKRLTIGMTARYT
jgi:hypothetical protein